MNKKDYQKPAMRVVLLQHQQHLLDGSYGVNSVDSKNLDDADDFIFGGSDTGYIGGAR